MSFATVGAGATLAAAAATAYESGYALQALEARAVDRRHALRPSLYARLVRRPLFVAGTALSLAGFGLQVAALARAPLAVVQPILALGLVALLAIGSRLLSEPIGPRQVAACLTIAAGAAGLALSAPATSSHPRPVPLAFALLALSALTAAPFVVRRAPTGMLAAACGAGDALAAIAAKLLAGELARGRALAALAWALTAAAAALVGFNSELSALGRAPATRVAPVVLAMQVSIPVALAPLVASEPLGGPLAVGSLAAVAGGVALLGSSAAVGGMFAAGEGEHLGGGAGQRGE